MNIQDVAEFIDLVKNPVKYEKLLQNIKEEQDRLQAVIATVGEASELSKLRTDLEKKKGELEIDYTKKVDALEKSYVSRLKKVEKLQLDLEDKLVQATQATNDANLKQASAEALAASFAGRDKKIKEQEKQVADLRVELQNNVTEYNIKLDKIRSLGII